MLVFDVEGYESLVAANEADYFEEVNGATKEAFDHV